MNIAIDANEANTKNRVGIGRYALNVLKGLKEINKTSKSPIKFQIYIKNDPLPDLPQKSAFWTYQKLNPSKFWTQIALPIQLLKEKNTSSLLYSTSHYSPFLTNIKSVISIMDLSYLHYPSLFKKIDLIKLKIWTKLSVLKAQKIITISNFSKSEIIKYYKVLPEKIVVAYPGVDTSIFKPGDNKKEDYILFVGTLQPRKNIRVLIKAFGKIIKKRSIRLKIAGKKGWLYNDIFAFVKERGLETHIDFVNFVSDLYLVKLYQKASCFILPSLYEGFGIPVVEAFACGCPVIASNTSSLPEIVGNAGLLFSPFDSDQLALLIEKILDNKKLRENFISEGLKKTKEFNWKKTAQIIYTTLTGN